MTTGSDAWTLARDIIEVHGEESATVARGNARAAALAGQPDQAKSWIRVLDLIQRHQAHNAVEPGGPDSPPRSVSGLDTTEGSS
jgi:hypothetical protein